jgi:primosomal protein N' (replication factor Y) (superfamily II helicase)
VAEIKPLRLRTQRVAKKVEIAIQDPVVQVCVDTGVFHLAEEFDYLVPERLSRQIFPGSLVKIPFGTKERIGYVVSRDPSNVDSAKLKAISKLVSPIPLLSTELIEIVRAVCSRYSAKPWDVIRSAIPPRVAAVDEKFTDFTPLILNQTGRSHHYELTVSANIDGLRKLIFELSANPIAGEQILVVVPDERDIRVLLDGDLPYSPIVLNSDLSKSERYENYLIARTRSPEVIIGTRSAIFLPLNPNSTIVVCDDGDESMYERRSPGWNVRDVALLRSEYHSLHFFGASPSLELVRLAESGWLKAKKLTSDALADRTPIYFSNTEISEISVIKSGLLSGNVLVAMAESGYINAIGCQKCRNQAKCSCGGKLYIPERDSTPICHLCEKKFVDWKCVWCEGKVIRSFAKGAAKFAEEIARSVPGARVISSKGGSRIDSLPKSAENLLVVSSYGCEPSGKYSAVVCLSLENLTNRVDLRSLEIARRLIFDNLNRISQGKGSVIYVDLKSENPISQGLLRRDAYGLALSELLERESSDLPPFTRIATVSGEGAVIRVLADQFQDNNLFCGLSILELAGDKSGISKMILRARISKSAEFSHFFRDLMRYRSIKGLPALQIRLDPYSI